jgi:hypothetical protein
MQETCIAGAVEGLQTEARRVNENVYPEMEYYKKLGGEYI